jgi:hypothetical protein
MHRKPLRLNTEKPRKTTSKPQQLNKKHGKPSRLNTVKPRKKITSKPQQLSKKHGKPSTKSTETPEKFGILTRAPFGDNIDTGSGLVLTFLVVSNRDKECQKSE